MLRNTAFDPIFYFRDLQKGRTAEFINLNFVAAIYSIMRTATNTEHDSRLIHFHVKARRLSGIPEIAVWVLH